MYSYLGNVHPPLPKPSIPNDDLRQSPRTDLAGRCSSEPRRANEHNLHLQWSARTKTAIENVRSWGVDLPPTFFSLCVLKFRWIGPCFSKKDFQVPIGSFHRLDDVQLSAGRINKPNTIQRWGGFLSKNCLKYKAQKFDELDNKKMTN